MSGFQPLLFKMDLPNKRADQALGNKESWFLAY